MARRGALRAAVVGVGHLGRHHARIYSEMPDVELVAVCDLNARRGRDLAESLSAEYLQDFHQLAGRVSIASVAVPTNEHFRVASYLLSEGINVLVEKPMTRTLQEARDLIKIAASTGAVLQVGHVERFNPVVLAIRSFHIEPKFIECHRLSPFTFRSIDIGVVMDLMIHDLDIVLQLAASPLKRLEAVGVPVIGELEDIANARLTFENGCVANVTASRVSMHPMRRVRVFSPECYITLDYGKREGWLYKKGPKLTPGALKFEEVDLSKVKDFRDFLFNDLLRVEKIPISDEEPLVKELEAFVQSVRTGKSLGVSGEEGLRALEVANLILEKIQSAPWYSNRKE